MMKKAPAAAFFPKCPLPRTGAEWKKLPALPPETSSLLLKMLTMGGGGKRALKALADKDLAKSEIASFLGTDALLAAALSAGPDGRYAVLLNLAELSIGVRQEYSKLGKGWGVPASDDVLLFAVYSFHQRLKAARRQGKGAQGADVAEKV